MVASTTPCLRGSRWPTLPYPKTALRGGITGGLFAFVGGVGHENAWSHNIEGQFKYIASHAAVGCMSAVMDGAQCGQGAVGAAFGKFTTLVLPQDTAGQMLGSVLAGGVGAKIAGGNFARGASNALMGYLFNHGFSKKEIAGMYAANKPKGHHQFSENLMNKYDDYISKEVADVAASDARIGAGSVSRRLDGDPHNGYNKQHRDADAALSTQMDKWIADGRISAANPMTKKQFYEFLNEARRNPTIGDYWKAIQDFHFQQVKLGNVRGASGGVKPPIQPGD